MKGLVIKQNWDRRAKYFTALVLFLFVATDIWLVFRSTGSFLPAWFLLQSLSLLFLVLIGMPRRIIIDEDRILAVNTLRLVGLDKTNIESISVAGKFAIPVFSTLGLFGYNGIYYFRNEKCIAEVFAKSWSNLLIIKCLSGKKYVIGVEDYEKTLKQLTEYGYCCQSE